MNSNDEPYNQNLSSSICLPYHYRPYTLDCDPREIPHLLANITKLAQLSGIPNESVDEIYLDGVTYEKVYTPDSGLYDILFAKLKNGGRFITTYRRESVEELRKRGFIATDDFVDHFNYRERPKCYQKRVRTNFLLSTSKSH